MTVCFKVRPRLVYFLVNSCLTTFNSCSVLIADKENPKNNITDYEMKPPPSSSPSSEHRYRE